jgi:hypothetical protein
MEFLIDMYSVSALICFLLLAYAATGAEELIFFAEDQFKSIGAPKLAASIVNPVLEPGRDEVVTIALANNGRLEELILVGNGSTDDASKEMREEMRCVDAINVEVRLLGNEFVNVSPGKKSISFLPSGSVVLIEFNISAGAIAEGWQDLDLELKYDHQSDVSVYNGEVSPLYQPISLTLPVKILVQGSGVPLEVVSVKSELYPGYRGMLWVAVKNIGSEVMRNCTARLITTHPFVSESESTSLGDLKPKKLSLVEFPLSVKSDASLGEYQLSCRMEYQNGTVFLPIPLILTQVPNPLLRYWFLLIALMMALVVVVASAKSVIGARKKRRRKSLRRSGR